MYGQERLDAAESAFFARELEHIQSEALNVLYPELMARDFVPVAGEADQGAETITYRQFDKVGEAKIISDNAKDIPRADISGQEFTRPVRSVAMAYGWTLQEIRAAAMARRNLNADKAMATRRGIEVRLDEIACFGAPDHGIAEGFLNSSAVATQSVPDPGSGEEWVNKTPDQILTDVSAAIQRIVNTSLGVHRPNTVLLPTAVDALIATTPRSSTSDTTIKSYILAAFPMITSIEGWYRLDDAGTGSSGRMVVYQRDPMVLRQDIPSEFETLPVQEQGLEFIVHALARTAGTEIPYPLAVDFSDLVS